MSDFFFSGSSFANGIGYFNFGAKAPTWGFLLAFLILMTAIDLFRLARAYSVAGRSDEAARAVLGSLPGSLLSCTGGLLLSLLMGMSVMLLLRVVVLGVIAIIFDTEQNPETSPVFFTWFAFGFSLLLAMVALFSLRSPDVVVDTDDEDDDATRRGNRPD